LGDGAGASDPVALDGGGPGGGAKVGTSEGLERRRERDYSPFKEGKDASKWREREDRKTNCIHVDSGGYFLVLTWEKRCTQVSERSTFEVSELGAARSVSVSFLDHFSPSSANTKDQDSRRR